MTTDATSTTAAPAPAPAPVAAPAPAPAPAPVATDISAEPAVVAPAVAPATEPATATPAPAGPVSYEPTGDPGLDMALGFVGKLGIPASDPAMVAAEQGNFALLKAKLALLGDKAQGWEQVIALGETAIAGLKAKADARQKATQDAILSAFGEDRDAATKQWGEVQAWARENAEPEERAAVNAALSAGGIAAKAMAAYLRGLHGKHPSATVEPAVVTKIGGNGSSADSAALSPAAYKAAVHELRGKLGGALDSSPEYRALQARRMMWRPATV